MRYTLTLDQTRVFEYLQHWIFTNGYAPPAITICADLGINRHVLGRHLINLRRRGWIDWLMNDYSTITILPDTHTYFPSQTPPAKPHALARGRNRNTSTGA